MGFSFQVMNPSPKHRALGVSEVWRISEWQGCWGRDPGFQSWFRGSQIWSFWKVEFGTHRGRVKRVARVKIPVGDLASPQV